MLSGRLVILSQIYYNRMGDQPWKIGVEYCSDGISGILCKPAERSPRDPGAVDAGPVLGPQRPFGTAALVVVIPNWWWEGVQHIPHKHMALALEVVLVFRREVSGTVIPITGRTSCRPMARIKKRAAPEDGP